MPSADSRSMMKSFCRDYFTKALPFPAFGMAIVEHESNFDTWAEATDPRDLARGGSRGLTQMSLKTALSLDPTIHPDDLFFPSVNLGLFIKLTKSNLHAVQKLTPGSSSWVRGLASMHNAGRIMANPSPEVVTYMDSVWALYQKWDKVLKEAHEG